MCSAHDDDVDGRRQRRRRFDADDDDGEKGEKRARCTIRVSLGCVLFAAAAAAAKLEEQITQDRKNCKAQYREECSRQVARDSLFQFAKLIRIKIRNYNSENRSAAVQSLKLWACIMVSWYTNIITRKLCYK